MSMSEGIYVRGWKFDWDESKAYTDRMYAAGRPEAAAHVADPGCCSCETCGELHMKEFEVFLCGRCGAECQIITEDFRSTVLSGRATKPEMIRPKLLDGLRVKFLGKRNWKGEREPGHWPAGTVFPGHLGTIRRIGPGNMAMDWGIEFDRVTPRVPYHFGTFGPFLDDEFEIAG